MDTKLPNRRTAIKTGLGAIALAGCGTTRNYDSGWIDAHSHIWTNDPAELKEFPLATGRTIDDLKPTRFTADDLIILGITQGVKRHVIISHRHYHGFSNDYYTHAVAKHPGTFAVVGGLDHNQPNVKARIKVNRSLGITGYRIKPDGQGLRWLENDRMNEMWQAAGNESVAICLLIDPQYVATIAPLAKRYPHTKVVIDHCARIDMQHTDELNNLCNLAKHRNVYVKISAFYAFGAKKPPYLEQIPRITQLLDAYGPERLMWASDCPYQLDPPNFYAASISLIRDRIDVLSDGDKEHLLKKTAEKIYFT